MVTETDRAQLRRCVTLAREALEAGDAPFGSVLVDGNGVVKAEDRNRVVSHDSTYHPEFALARWAALNMTEQERADATVYTSGEHCPMCSAAHAWAGLGRIVYASSGQQLSDWLVELGAAAPPVRLLAVQEIAPHVTVQGPVPEFAQQVRELHIQNQAG